MTTTFTHDDIDTVQDAVWRIIDFIRRTIAGFHRLGSRIDDQEPVDRFKADLGALLQGMLSRANPWPTPEERRAWRRTFRMLAHSFEEMLQRLERAFTTALADVREIYPALPSTAFPEAIIVGSLQVAQEANKMLLAAGMLFNSECRLWQGEPRGERGDWRPEWN